MSESTADFNKDAYDALSTELSYRRDRRHTIFRWCNSMLVAIIGGLVAFADKEKDLDLPNRYIITTTIVILATFTLTWTFHHYKIEKKIQGQIDCKNCILGIRACTSGWRIDWNQTAAVLGLAGTALAATWLKLLATFLTSLARL